MWIFWLKMVAIVVGLVGFWLVGWLYFSLSYC